MKHLLIDVGNTRIKWLMLNDGSKVVSAVCPCDAYAHNGDFENAVHQCFSSIDFSSESECRVIVSNVAGNKASQEINAFFEVQWKVTPLFIAVTRNVADIQNNYEQLSELGVDRWIAVVGARQLFDKGSLIVINCGTAITVDLLDGLNVFQGGAILPGFDLSMSALSKADGIDRFQSSDVGSVLGVTTQECVRLGVFSACVGGIERMISNICSLLSSGELSKLNIVVSGGSANLFLGATTLDCEYDPNVIIRGLYRLSK
jgi:type III pantothenate kinase